MVLNKGLFLWYYKFAKSLDGIVRIIVFSDSLQYLNVCIQFIFDIYQLYQCFYTYSVFRDPSLVFNPPETKAHDYIIVEFHCLLNVQQWGFNNTSDVFMRFDAPEFGHFKYCYGPMQKINRFVNCNCLCSYIIVVIIHQ